MTLVENLQSLWINILVDPSSYRGQEGQIKLRFPLRGDPQALRQIILLVAEEMPKFLKGYAEFLKHPSKTDEFERIDKLSLDMSKLYNNWLAQELRAEAEKLK